MKKRRQVPDAHTYTLVLRGLAWNHAYPRSISRALTVYHSMFADNCPVKPSVIHTNAVLQVCALADDMEALWGIAAKLPGSGKNAADTTTFTIILNAIRNNVIEDTKHDDVEDEEHHRKLREDAQSQCRRIWADVIERWRKGDLMIDESLVCAVGHILLVTGGSYGDSDVLDLVEQTMAIPRQLPRKAETANRSPVPILKASQGHSRERNDQTGAGIALTLASEEKSDLALQEQALEQDFPPHGEFLPLPNPDRKLAYAAPSRKTLSLIIAACSNLKAMIPAQNYWNLLTSPEGQYRIPPDRENYVQILRNFRVRRASKMSLMILQEIQHRLGEVPERKAFRIALSTCCRDTRNPNVLENTRAIYGMMNTSSSDVDIECLSDYLTVVFNAKIESWRHMDEALKIAWPAVDILRDSPNAKRRDYSTATKDRYGITSIAERLMRAWDHCLIKAESEATREEWRSMIDRKNKLVSWNQRLRGQQVDKELSRRRNSLEDEDRRMVKEVSSCPRPSEDEDRHTTPSRGDRPFRRQVKSRHRGFPRDLQSLEDDDRPAIPRSGDRPYGHEVAPKDRVGFIIRAQNLGAMERSRNNRSSAARRIRYT